MFKKRKQRKAEAQEVLQEGEKIRLDLIKYAGEHNGQIREEEARKMSLQHHYQLIMHLGLDTFERQTHTEYDRMDGNTFTYEGLQVPYEKREEMLKLLMVSNAKR